MELIVFDLDGTLLSGKSEISDGTRKTLAALAERDIAYTVATGRSLHMSRDLLRDHGFRLPQVLKNGVMVWDPSTQRSSWQNCLTLAEIEQVMSAMLEQDVSPFVSTVAPGDRHAIYHPPVRHKIEQGLADHYKSNRDIVIRPLGELPANEDIVSISAIGDAPAIDRVRAVIDDEPHLVAYSSYALEGRDWRWIDIHHTDATKGAAVLSLKEQLGMSRVLCFGDGSNDLSMFEAADEAFAPSNADSDVKAAATAVIGHHDEDGIAEFLKERYELDC